MLWAKNVILLFVIVVTGPSGVIESLLISDITTTFTSAFRRGESTRRTSLAPSHSTTFLRLAARRNNNSNKSNNQRQKNDKSSKRKKTQRGGTYDDDKSVAGGRTTAKKATQSSKKPAAKKLPRLIVFDLDGCLWKPELFEILTCPRRHTVLNQYAGESGVDSGGFDSAIDKSSNFVQNLKDNIAGTTLRSYPDGIYTMELLHDTREILHSLYYDEMWYGTYVGISSRTDPKVWAMEIMSLFSIYYTKNDIDGNSSTDLLPTTVAMKDIFEPSLCILDKGMDKRTQFEMLLQEANKLVQQQQQQQFSSSNTKPIQYKDMIFFDNEIGNCKQVSNLGVNAVYTPKGLTWDAFRNGISSM